MVVSTLKNRAWYDHFRFDTLPVSYFFESLDKDEKVLNYYNSFINDNHSNVSVIAEDKLEFNSCDKSSDDFIDPMLHTDSLQLISSYWKIKDPDTRKKNWI